MIEKPNVLIVGASGGVGNALLHHFTVERDLFGALILLDRNKKVLDDIYIDHKRLNYVFVQHELELPSKQAEYHQILREHNIHIVLDVTDMDSIPFWEATDAAGVSYVNTGMNDDDQSIQALVISAFARKDQFNKAPHILCTGMNPGNVNMWVRYGIEKFGVPTELIHFEYDTSKIARKWHPMMTWSVHEFIIECVHDPGGIVLGKGTDKVKELLPNALEHRKNMRSILEPIMKLDAYPEGMLVLHEECASIAQKYDIPSQFIYAVNPQTMALLIKLYERDGHVTREALELGDNTHRILDGADSIGVILEYEHKKVYYFNTIPSVAIIGTNATYTQVVIGILSALHVLMFDSLEPKAYFPEDLYDTCYKNFMFDNLRVQEFVFEKSKGHLKLSSFNPMIKSHRKGYEHDYVI